jgi:circadian clock protein KaiC
VALNLLSTGVPGLDEVFGGGLPEYSFNLVAGVPGAGKTTLVHQMTFANASAERPALYFTVLGEPALKMLRYQQQMGFFDVEKVGTVIQFIDLSAVVLENDLPKLLDVIVHHVEEKNPAIVVVDSFRTVMRAVVGGAGNELELQDFLQRLALHLTSWEVTSFLVGEYGEAEMHENPVFTIADSILWLTQSKERSSIVRKLEVMKMRGRAPLPGLHTFRMSDAGIRVFPRSSSSTKRHARVPRLAIRPRASLGDPGFDALCGGGLPAGDTTLVAGPSGTGKTALSSQFIAAGGEAAEPGVIAVFEENPEDYMARAKSMGVNLERMDREGRLKVVYMRPVDLSSDETLFLIREAIAEVGARTPGHRLPQWPRACHRAELPGRLPGVFVPHGGRSRGERHQRHPHHRGHGVLRPAPLQPPLGLVPGAKHHLLPLRGDRRTPRQGGGGHQDATQRSQPRHPPL